MSSEFEQKFEQYPDNAQTVAKANQQRGGYAAQRDEHTAQNQQQLHLAR
jgi:hypothetical protein